jgi:hypothetical protein
MSLRFLLEIQYSMYHLVHKPTTIILTCAVFSVPELYVTALGESAHIFGGRYEAQCHVIEVPASILGRDSICSV